MVIFFKPKQYLFYYFRW